MNVEVMKANTQTMPILGTYTGECLDPHITNKNGMDITHEVIDGVFASDDYEQGIKNGWFIGFLGHPEDPNCMDFQNGCIVMREMHYGDDGKLYGTWDLLNTPVGQIVATMQAAGIKFGISIRGAGDVIGSEVQADGFVFRGYDLVSFPAFPDSIPEFTAIAASTDTASREKYQKICAAVKTNLPAITSASALNALKSYLPAQSEIRKLVEAREQELRSQNDVSSASGIDKERIVAMTDLYLKELAKSKDLQRQVLAATKEANVAKSQARRKLAAIQRITAAQTVDFKKAIAAAEAKSAKSDAEKSKLSRKYVSASTQIKSMTESNLKYKQDLEAANRTIASQRSELAKLRSQKRETVAASVKLEQKSSNLDGQVSTLKQQVSVQASQLLDFKKAYASLYATVIGSSDESIDITAATTAEDIRRQIVGATNSANIAAAPSADMVDDYYDEFTDETSEQDDSNLITM